MRPPVQMTRGLQHETRHAGHLRLPALYCSMSVLVSPGRMLVPAGLVVVTYPDVSKTLGIIRAADEAGVGTVWQTVGATRPDAVTTYAAAAVQTERIRLGTSIVPTYPRHPAALASQV